MNFQQVLIVVSVVISTISNTEAASCLAQFKNAKAIDSTANVCSKRLEQTHQIKLADLPKPTKENHWNDKCYSNCTLRELNLMTNKTILKDSMIAMIKANAPTAAVAKIIAIVNECAETNTNVTMKLSMKRDHTQKSTEKPRGDKVSPKFDLAKMKDVNATNKMHKDHYAKFACVKAAKFMACFTEKEARVC